ncbi:hypothetical protein OIU76_023456 [Salix suchowensis]|nr:hypothetical protein OIU76_023456 [Salix suchowensis]
MITFMIWRKQKNFDTWILFQNLLLLFAGGKSSLACPRGISLAEVYDPALDEWKALPDMSTTRYKCVGVTWQGKIHVVGGFAEKVNKESYGGKLNSWIVVDGSHLQTLAILSHLHVGRRWAKPATVPTALSYRGTN